MAAQTEKLTLEVATPVGLALRTQTESVQAPSVRGEFGVLPGHLPLLAAVRAGVLRYRIEGKDHEAAIGPGFIEAGPDKVRLLTELFAKPEEVDIEATKAELVAAEEWKRSRVSAAARSRVVAVHAAGTRRHRGVFERVAA